MLVRAVRRDISCTIQNANKTGTLTCPHCAPWPGSPGRPKGLRTRGVCDHGLKTEPELVNGAGFAIQIWKNVIITDIMSTQFYTIPAPSSEARLNNYTSFLEIMHLSESQIHRKTSLLPCNYSFNSQLMHRYCQLRSISSAPLVTSPYHGLAYSL